MIKQAGCLIQLVWLQRNATDGAALTEESLVDVQRARQVLGAGTCSSRLCQGVKELNVDGCTYAGIPSRLCCVRVSVKIHGNWSCCNILLPNLSWR